jgi:cytidyltransferase-like protein
MKVIMVSGYFDPIHPGHISYLEEAKKLGDKLIVIIDGDKRTTKKKGKPFIPAVDRLEIIKALRCVDEAYIEDVDVKESLKRITPDVFAKGGDRVDRESIPEWDLCKELGIEIVTGVGKDKRWSSSDYLEDWAEFILFESLRT